MEAYKKAFEQLVSQLDAMPEALDVPNAVYVALADAKDIVYASLAKPLPVRYFALVNEDDDVKEVEVTMNCFEWLASTNVHIVYNRHTMHENGANQICLTADSIYSVEDLDLL
jgi:hypothetical protein